MPKTDENGREYIEQDGKRYYRNFWGGWEAEKDIFGNEKVETDIFGDPKIERDIFGNQKIETDWFGNPYVKSEKKDDSGCYLTTACMRAKGDSFDDNCHELMVLRQFRDNYVKKTHPMAVEEYYRIAPQIVEAINKRSDNQEIFNKLYEELVMGTINLIKDKREEDAYVLYQDYCLNLKRLFLSVWQHCSGATGSQRCAN